MRQHVVIYRYGPAVETLLEELSRAGSRAARLPVASALREL